MDFQTVVAVRNRRKFWPVLGVFLFATLLASVALRAIVAPVGDAVTASFGGLNSDFIGVISDLREAQPDLQPSATTVSATSYALYDGRSYHLLVGSPIPKALAGHKVRVTGTMQKSGTLSVNAIQQLD